MKRWSKSPEILIEKQNIQAVKRSSAMKISVLKLDWNINRVSTVCRKIVFEISDFLQLRLIGMRYFFANVYLTGFF